MSHQADPAINSECDRILNSMVAGCKSIRTTVITTSSLQLKDKCCANWRFNICVQSASGYSTIAKATGICSSDVYERKMGELSPNLAMNSVANLCANFDTQTCITSPMSNAWDSVKTNVQSVQSNLNVNQIANQIGKNWNQAMSSFGSMAKNLQDTISQQNIPARLREGASAIQSTIVGGTQQLSDAISGQGINRYSVVGNEGADDAVSLDSIVHSIIPDVEIVEKKPLESVDTPKVDSKSDPTKRFNFMDWFDSLHAGLIGSSNSEPIVPKITKQTEQRSNPYV